MWSQPPEGCDASAWSQANDRLIAVIKIIKHLRDVFFKDKDDDDKDDNNKAHEIWHTYFLDMSESVTKTVDVVYNIKISPGKSMHSVRTSRR